MPTDRLTLSDDYDNRVGTESVRKRAEAVIWDSLSQSDAFIQQKEASWNDVEKLMSLESTSQPASEMGVHMGEAFDAREDVATRFHRIVFGSPTNPLLNAELEDEGDAKRGKVAAALVEEAWRLDMKFEQKGLEWAREVFGYGALFFKALPHFEKKRLKERTVKMIPNPNGGGPATYRFSNYKVREIEDFRIKNTAINPRYFRYAPGADDIESALWCGDWQTIVADEFDLMREQGLYGGPDLEKAAAELLKHSRNRRTSAGQYSANSMVGMNEYSSVLSASLKKQQVASNIGQLAVFEWHGMFDLEGDGSHVMSMIVAAFPTDAMGRVHKRRGNAKMWILSVGESPFAHQRKPYFFWPCIKKNGDADGISVVDLVKNHSDYADEFYTLGLLGAHMEVNPPLIIEDNDIPDEAVQGFIYGKKIRGRRDGIGFLDMPNKSGQAFRIAEFIQGNNRQHVGLGNISNAPRVAAAGIMEQSQTEDMRLLAYVNPFEQYCLIPGSQLIHSYYRQYMTTERAVRAIGLDGIYARTRATVSPTDLAMDIRFEPAVGQHLSQKAFQSNILLQTIDRALVINQQRAAMGQQPVMNVPEMMRSAYAVGYGIQDTDRFIYNDVEPEMIRTAMEEHELFGYGQRPGIQRGENKLQHALQHLAYYGKGMPELVREEDRLAFLDHLLETIEAVMRQVEASSPDMKDLIQAQFQQVLGQTQGSRPGFMPQGEPQQNGGSRGITSNVSLAPGSPMIRPERPDGGQQSAAMGFAGTMGGR